jgi:hypothetical protein
MIRTEQALLLWTSAYVVLEIEHLAHGADAVVMAGSRDTYRQASHAYRHLVLEARGAVLIW